MNRKFAVAVTLTALLGTAGAAFAQMNPQTSPAGTPAPYAPPVAAPAPAMNAPTTSDGTHTGGGAARAYSHTGSQKSN